MAAAMTVGMVGGGTGASCSASSWSMRFRRRLDNKTSRVRAGSVSASAISVADPYRTLKIERGASESEVKKAFRRLALQYHPDVCKGDNCTVRFHQINEAYDIVMNSLRGESMASEMEGYDSGVDESLRGMNDPDWDLWEEWMGWEGAGIRDYTSHINPYI
ncbi:hypothetical protein Ancab_029866 [Ancistrocladus abbreviatus]